MRQYQIKETKEIKKIICNQCGKEIPVVDGYPREGVFSVDQEWGYFPKKTVRDTALTCARNAMTGCSRLSNCLRR